MRLSDLQVTHGFAEVNGIRLHYVEKGTGPLVLLLHGFPEMWWSWRYQIDPLVEAGFHVVAPDLRGYNESDKTGPYDLDTLVEDVRAFIERMGNSTVQIVAHDWGGAVAWHLAATRPEACERVAILNCPHPVQFRRALSHWSQVKRSWYVFFFQLPWIPERLLTRHDADAIRRLFLGNAKDRSHFGPEETQPFCEAIQKPGAARAMLGWYRALMRTAILDRTRFERYPVVEAPVLLIWAKSDRALGFEDLVPGTERWVRKLELKTLEPCGHFVHSEKPEPVNAWLLEFLRAGPRNTLSNGTAHSRQA